MTGHQHVDLTGRPTPTPRMRAQPAPGGGDDPWPGSHGRTVMGDELARAAAGLWRIGHPAAVHGPGCPGMGCPDCMDADIPTPTEAELMDVPGDGYGTDDMFRLIRGES